MVSIWLGAQEVRHTKLMIFQKKVVIKVLKTSLFTSVKKLFICGFFFSFETGEKKL